MLCTELLGPSHMEGFCAFLPAYPSHQKPSSSQTAPEKVSLTPVAQGWSPLSSHDAHCLLNWHVMPVDAALCSTVGPLRAYSLDGFYIVTTYWALKISLELSYLQVLYFS